jgi:hypothetical protein
MQAHVGDWIDLPEGPGHPHLRRGLVVGVNHPDGTPPYHVRWLDDERESVLIPPPDAHIGRSSSTAADRGGGGGDAT